jgi:hypothetical protein
MQISKRFAPIIAALVLCAAHSFASTIEIHGVKIPESITVAGTELERNGAGTRYRGPFKVYVADLYTTQKVTSLDALVAAPGPKRLSMTMLREIESGPFGKLLTRGVEDNVSKNEMSKLIPGLMRMGDIFTAVKVLNPGDVIILDWIPGTGMVITVKGKAQGEPFKEPEFFRAMMSIWLGNSPADAKLKEALLKGN